MLLQDRKPRPWPLPQGAKASFKPEGYYLGSGTKTPLEVAIARSGARPTESDVRSLWKKRRGATPSPFLLIVVWPSATGERASVCGTTGDDPAVYSDRDLGQLRAWPTLALTEPDHHAAATRFLAVYLPEERGGAYANVALFASHHLRDSGASSTETGRHLCAAASDAPGASASAARSRRSGLPSNLEATAKSCCGPLRQGPRPGGGRLLGRWREPRGSAARDSTASPRLVGDRLGESADNIPYVVVTRGPQIRVYTTRAGAGLAGKGRTGAFRRALAFRCSAADDAGYLPLLAFSGQPHPRGALRAAPGRDATTSSPIWEPPSLPRSTTTPCPDLAQALGRRARGGAVTAQASRRSTARR